MDRAQEQDDARRKGLAEGTRQAKQEVARNFKALGVSVQIIAKATGLTEDEIANL